MTVSCRGRVKLLLLCLVSVHNLGSSPVSSVNLFLMASLTMNHNLGQWTVKSEPYHKDHGQYLDKSQLCIKVPGILHLLWNAGLCALSIGGSWNINMGMSDCQQPPSAPAGDNSFSLASLLAAWELVQTFSSPAHQSWWSGAETSLLSPSFHVVYTYTVGSITMLFIVKWQVAGSGMYTWCITAPLHSFSPSYLP